MKSVYTNIRHNLLRTVIEYWIERIQNNLPLLQRFTRKLVLQGLSIILQFNIFTLTNHFFTKLKEQQWGQNLLW